MQCEQCGYDYATIPRQDLTAALSAEAEALIAELLTAERLGERPAPEVWSAHEYACHVRDVLEWQDRRVRLAQAEDVPALEPMGREERVAGYADADPSDVPPAIRSNVVRLIGTLEALDSAGWERRVVYNYPTKAERSVEWIATHTIHELVHHRQDIAAVGNGNIPG